MQDTFQWIPELINEFFQEALKNPGGSFINNMKAFISSKSPKKEWEIVAYGEIYEGEKLMYKLQPSGGYRNEDWECDIEYDATQFNNPNEFIHSVRRLSDASEWQVKEKVDVWETGCFTIQSFEISAGQMLAKTDGGTYLLNALIKLPQPILTTVDGVQMRENEECWIVDKHYNLLPEPEKINEFKRNYFSNCFIFSTREAAEKYILDHAEKLSLNDVKEGLKAIPPLAGHSSLLEVLTALVKQKLNQ